MKKEYYLVKRDNFERNLERERRKQDWKKLNVIAREKLVEERIMTARSERDFIHKAKV